MGIDDEKNDFFTPKTCGQVLDMPIARCQHLWTFFTVRKRKWIMFSVDYLYKGCRLCGDVNKVF